MSLGRGRNAYVPLVVLAAAMTLVALQLVPVAIAFFAAAVLLLLLRVLSLREAYEVVEWPILILLGALIPVSEAVRTTGGTDLIAGWLSVAAGVLPPVGALALLLVVAMAVTPFLNNAATVLMMAPIAAGLATNLKLSPDAFLMAVAIGAACDFLTPIGHQCNTLVMGPGGYRFGDYWRLGLPLSIIVVLLGVPLIALVWPLRAGLIPHHLNASTSVRGTGMTRRPCQSPSRLSLATISSLWFQGRISTKSGRSSIRRARPTIGMRQPGMSLPFLAGVSSMMQPILVGRGLARIAIELHGTGRLVCL